MEEHNTISLRQSVKQCLFFVYMYNLLKKSNKIFIFLPKLGKGFLWKSLQASAVNISKKGYNTVIYRELKLQSTQHFKIPKKCTILEDKSGLNTPNVQRLSIN